MRIDGPIKSLASYRSYLYNTLILKCLSGREREGFEPEETLNGISNLLKSFVFLSPQIPFPPQSWQ